VPGPVLTTWQPSSAAPSPSPVLLVAVSLIDGRRVTPVTLGAYPPSPGAMSFAAASDRRVQGLLAERGGDSSWRS
jgi:hypothetical protein